MNTISVVIGIFAVGSVISVWYILQPAVYTIIHESELTLINFEANRTESATVYDMLEYINNLWGPAVAIIIVVWMLISAQSGDYRSAYEQPY